MKFSPASPRRAGLEKSNRRACASRGRSKYRFQWGILWCWGISRGLVLLAPTFPLGSRGRLGRAPCPPAGSHRPLSCPSSRLDQEGWVPFFHLHRLLANASTPSFCFLSLDPFYNGFIFCFLPPLQALSLGLPC